MENANLTVVVRAAERATLAVAGDPVSRELYGTAERVLDETATLRRVALFYRGTGAYRLTSEERDVALAVVRARFAAKYEVR